MLLEILFPDNKNDNYIVRQIFLILKGNNIDRFCSHQVDNPLFTLITYIYILQIVRLNISLIRVVPALILEERHNSQFFNWIYYF